MNYQHFVSPDTAFHTLSTPFSLESGEQLFGVQVAYRTWGSLNAARDNAVLICHAFTGSADADYWWAPLFGSGKALDPDRDFIICSNILGSCYGTTGPTSINPKTGEMYGANFPQITVRDMVHLQARFLEELGVYSRSGVGVPSLKLVIGGSLGGMQVLEWAVLYPERVRALAPIAISGRHSAWCIAWSETQRQAIYADPNWNGGHYSDDHPPTQGLAIARMIAMSTYRSWESFEQRFGRQLQQNKAKEQFAISSYLQYQGEKLVERFDANTYVILTHAMDSHDLSRPDRDYESVLRNIPHPTLVVGITTDVLYPPAEQEELANLIPQAKLFWLNSPHGHDAFLIDMDQLNDFVVKFRQEFKL